MIDMLIAKAITQVTNTAGFLVDAELDFKHQARPGLQAARVVLLWPAKWHQHSFERWLTAAAERLHHNVLAAALANKLARIAWSVLSQTADSRPPSQPCSIPAMELEP